MRYWLSILTAFLCITGVSCNREGVDPETAARLQELRNLGKALYETPGSSEQAAETLRQALELAPDSARDRLNYGLALLRAGKAEAGIAELREVQREAPEIPHTWFNLGVEYKKAGETERAIEQFRKMVELVPDNAKAVYNLAQCYRQAELPAEALPLFEKASRLDPSLAAPHFQLFNLLRRDNPARAKQEIAAFQRIKKLQDETGLDEDVDWSFYSELYDPVDPGRPAQKAAATVFEAQPAWKLAQAPQRSGAAPLDKNRILTWSQDGLAILTPGKPPIAVGVEDLRSVGLGDTDNDGKADGCLVDGQGVRRLQIGEKALTLGDYWLEGDYESCLFQDYDHDGDQDLLAVGAKKTLLRNDGKDQWSPAELPLEQEQRGFAALGVELAEDNGIDLVVAHAGGVSVYQDRKLGVYDAPQAVAGAPALAGPVSLEAVDLDSDGDFDVVLTPGAGDSLILRNDEGTLAMGPKIPRALAWGDWQNRGATDFVRPEGLALSRGGMRYEAGDSQGLPADLVAAAAADLDGDGRVDLTVVDRSGQASFAFNRTPVKNAWASVSLTGVKSAVRAQGARVEVKAGETYRKQLYLGAPLHFGLGDRDRIETVRITWTNGMIQNELEQPVNQLFAYEEKPRLSGSCPMIFTWNGKGFEYIGEVLGVAPLGASLGDGRFFPVDHDEAIWIRGEQLEARDGFYDIRITEELREVAYLDEVKLLAVDHPAEEEIYLNEKFKAPPFPDFRLFRVNERQKVRPSRAVDHRGRDVLDRLRRRDGRTVDGFERTFRNTAELHSIEFSLDGLAGDRASRLFLTGWVDWADASTIVAGSQSPDGGLRMPVLQVRDERGEWRTVIEDLGLPGGQLRTMSVDLTGKFLSSSRDVRIVTNLCVYWDEAFAADGVGELSEAPAGWRAAAAELAFRGFSGNVVHPQRLEPESFVYAELHPVSNWNPTPGRYTRYGEVTELLEGIDDRLVVLGAGDELRLRFPAPAGGPPQGYRRDFVLLVDGWAKEQDANTAFGDRVEPLPFHRMSAYPYPEAEKSPQTREMADYFVRYQTRPALRLIRPLVRGSRVTERP
ncbi:MAG: tetratricopeptide repeat protein [Acidobacteria bacterium]|nr:tetratricopeptide repeat protein [Acidobacteriota bacterium]